jgi:hypothetical protein
VAPRFPVAYAGAGLTVYENPSPVPRAYVVHDAEVITTPRAALERLAAADFAPRATVVLEEPVELAAGGGAPGEADAADILSYEPEAVTIRAVAARPGLLVLTDQYYPGWSAEVDGVPVAIHRANYLFRAIPLPAGAHDVVFRYRPTWVGWAL